MKIPENAAAALAALEAAGYESYVVGGCVRDTLLGREPGDWDICTAARPEETEAVFAGERVLETGLRHGTVTLLTDGGALEITTFRTESGYTDGRRPDRVAFVTDIRTDLSRRDFTVNAMAWSPRRGLVDPFGGRADLAAGLLRCVGDPAARFGEDALRILRCLRFAARYGFAVHPDTEAALLECRDRLGNVSAERVFSELKGILRGEYAGAVLRRWPRVIFAVLPELEPMWGFDHRHPAAHQWDVWTHSTYAVDAAERDVTLRLAALLHDCGKPACYRYDEEKGRGRFFGHPRAGEAIARQVLDRLRCDNLTRDRVCRLIALHDARTDGSRRAVRRLLSRLGEEELRLLLALRRADAAAHTPAVCGKMTGELRRDEALLEALLAEEGRITPAALAVQGRDLLALGLAPGPAVGRLLEELLDRVLEEQLPNEREALLAAAKERIGEEMQ